MIDSFAMASAGAVIRDTKRSRDLESPHPIRAEIDFYGRGGSEAGDMGEQKTRLHIGRKIGTGELIVEPRVLFARTREIWCVGQGITPPVSFNAESLHPLCDTLD